jgi:hypothetical protein
MLHLLTIPNIPAFHLYNSILPSRFSTLDISHPAESSSNSWKTYRADKQDEGMLYLLKRRHCLHTTAPCLQPCSLSLQPPALS